MESDKKQASAIDPRIHLIRGVSVMLDSDLAALYGVTTGVLLQAVRRNRKRFPSDFMFSLTDQELTNLRSQFVISSSARTYGGRRYRPWVFTEQGVAMLSSVLRSDTAVRPIGFTADIEQGDPSNTSRRLQRARSA